MPASVFMRDCPRGHSVHAHHCQLQCEVLGDCTGDGHPLWTQFIRHFVDEMFDHSAPYYDFVSYLTQLATLRDQTSVKHADVVVCTAPMACSLLRAVLPDKHFIGYFGMAIHCNKNEKYDQMAVMHFVEMSRNVPFAVHNHFLMKQVEFSAGVTLPIIRPQGLYALLPQSWRSVSQLESDGLGGRYGRKLIDPYADAQTWHRERDTGFVFRSKYFVRSWVNPILNLVFHQVHTHTDARFQSQFNLDTSDRFRTFEELRS